MHVEAATRRTQPATRCTHPATPVHTPSPQPDAPSPQPDAPSPQPDAPGVGRNTCVGLAQAAYDARARTQAGAGTPPTVQLVHLAT